MIMAGELNEMSISVPDWLAWILFAMSLASMTAIYALSGLAVLRTDFQFFPPPNKHSWQHKSFMLLFRLFLYPLVALTILSFESFDDIAFDLRYGVGAALLLAGFGLAFWITLRMGWRNAFGEKRGLVTDGWFERSRNPVYVATWIGLAGWGLIANHWTVTILLCSWAVLYVLAPVVEEPWLEAHYGNTYREYKARTKRFF